MAYPAVDTTNLNSLFKYNPADDDSVDPEWELISNPNITVQDARAYDGGYAVNEFTEAGDESYSTHHGVFTHKKTAFKKAYDVSKIEGGK